VKKQREDTKRHRLRNRIAKKRVTDGFPKGGIRSSGVWHVKLACICSQL